MPCLGIGIGPGFGVAVPWNPDQVSGFYDEWNYTARVYSNDAGTTAAAVNDGVANWIGVRGHRWLQTTSTSRPTLTASGLSFDGTADYLDGTTDMAGVIQDQAGFTCAMLYTPTSAVGAAQRYLYITRNAAGSVRFNMIGNLGGLTGYVVSQSRRLDGDTAYTTTALVGVTAVNQVRIDRIDWENGVQSSHRNGTLLFSEEPAWTAGGNTSATASTQVTLSGSTAFGNFVLERVVFIQSYLSDADLAQLNTYMSTGI